MGSTDKVTTGLAMTAEDTGAGRFGQGAILNMVTARAHQRTPDQPCADCLDHSLGAGRRKPAFPRRGAFWLVALILAATMLAPRCQPRYMSSTRLSGISPRRS